MKRIADLTPAERLEQLRQKCHINDDGCWMWRGDRYTNGQPRAGAGGGKRAPAKSLALALSGRRAPEKHGTARCELEPNGCINPEHLRTLTRGQVIETSNRENRAAHLVRTARATRAVREKSDLMTAALAREIRNSGESGASIARRTGLGADYVRQIRRGRMWRDDVNPWRGLAA